MTTSTWTRVFFHTGSWKCSQPAGGVDGSVMTCDSALMVISAEDILWSGFGHSIPLPPWMTLNVTNTNHRMCTRKIKESFLPFISKGINTFIDYCCETSSGGGNPGSDKSSVQTNHLQPAHSEHCHKIPQSLIVSPLHPPETIERMKCLFWNSQRCNLSPCWVLKARISVSSCGTAEYIHKHSITH